MRLLFIFFIFRIVQFILEPEEMPEALLNVLPRFDGFVCAFLVLNASNVCRILMAKGKNRLIRDSAEGIFSAGAIAAGESVPAAVSPSTGEIPDRSAEYRAGIRKTFILP
ncbi:hypothetical protein [Akkermansia sp.]|uniref:hypothetical protein n=1 Tax=Akkermansia sp. TaxID=1872421 RepID=UPI0025C1F259|nr:hypothetical protein [Akkermansia sp.]MCD8272955.1 hypothetical protein [Akkermansia sp.]